MKKRSSISTKDKFFNHINKNGPNGCWLWTRKLSPKEKGYGRIYFKKTKRMLVHRYSWEIHNPDKPIGDLSVCHKCDNPSCVNPEHLWLGTHQDNMKDRNAKGRQKNNSGEHHPRSKLKNSDIYLIRKLINQGLSNARIAKIFNINHRTISAIKMKKLWRHI